MIALKTEKWKIEDIDFVIFDKDGTFIDIHKYWGRVVELRANAIIRYFNLSQNFYKPLCDVMGYDINSKKLPPDSPVGLYARGKVQEILLYFLIKNGVEALLPTSEMKDETQNPFNVFKVGDEIDVMIKKFTPQEHRIALSMKEV